MSPPAYELHLQPRSGYLHARVTGPVDTFEVSVAYWSELAAACAEGGVRRLLVVEELEGNTPPADMDAVVDALLQMGFRDIRVAFVDATEDTALLVGAEVRAQSQGFAGRVFRREADAERWLLADGDAPTVVRPGQAA
jgi:hypothetical protein